MQPPDFSYLARAYGYRYRLIEDPASLEQALREFGSRRQIVFLELRADGFE